MTSAQDFFRQAAGTSEQGLSAPVGRNASLVGAFRQAGAVNSAPAPAEEMLDDPAGEGIVAQSAAEVEDGIMVAFFPPHDIADELATHGTEPAGQLHITLAYLGKTADYRPDQLAALPKLVGGWAVQQKPLTIRIGGVGKFSNADQHVLWASADIPGGTHLHSGLEKFLGTHGYRTPSEHGWNPHMTLSYVRKNFRFMPSVPEVTWAADRVFVCIGGVHTPVILGGS